MQIAGVEPVLVGVRHRGVGIEHEQRDVVGPPVTDAHRLAISGSRP